MNIALIHDHYEQRGGEDQVFASEAALLGEYGHKVVKYTVYNEQITHMAAVSLAFSTIWNRHSARELRGFFRSGNFEVAHFHNTFPLISPAGYYAAIAEDLAVVQTLHNYRLLCPAATFFRGEEVCEDCLGKAIAWPGVLHGCYRGSRIASGVVGTMLAIHWALGTWQRMVDTYIALTDFAKAKFVEGGLPAERIVVKPNFVHPDPGIGKSTGKYGLYVGRLSLEKGVTTLLQAWERLNPGLPLRIVGDGTLIQQVAAAADRIGNLEWLGQQSRERVFALMKDAAFLIMPSLCYEGFPLVMAEAFATGLPVVASDLGGPCSIVTHGRTGRLFRPGDAEDLAAQVTWFKNHPIELEQMRVEARAEYEANYTAERHHDTLMAIYARAKRAAATRQG